MAEKVAKITVDAAKRVVKSVITPEPKPIRNDVSELKSELRVLNTQIEEMDKLFNSSFDATNERIDSVRTEVKW